MERMHGDIFTYGSPESVGIPSALLSRIYREASEGTFMHHSLLVARHGRIVAEGYFSPFEREDLHRMYSVTKSFVATAIGCLVTDGVVALDDTLERYFPDKITESTHRYIRGTTLRDLLRMASPYSVGATYAPTRDDWVDSFFTATPDHPSGTFFSYDTSASFILNVIVERLTGKPFIEYLKDRLLRPLGFSENAWCVGSPDGHSWGGSGLQCTTRDVARLGQLYLQGGRVDGVQLIDEQFVREATSRQIDNNTSGHIDHAHGNGYGYQIWCLSDGGFGFLGMGGQVMLAYPKLDLLMATTSDVQGASYGYSHLMNIFYDFLVRPLSEMEDAPLPEDPEALAELRSITDTLRCRLSLIGSVESPSAHRYIGKTYRMDENRMGIERFRIDLDGEGGTLTFFSRGEERRIDFGLGSLRLGTFPESQYFGRAIRTPKGEGYRTMAGALFTEEHKLVLRAFLIDDYFGNMTATFAFKGDEVSVFMTKTAEWFLDEYHGLGVGHRID